MLTCGLCKYFIFDDIIFQVGEEEGRGEGREGREGRVALVPVSLCASLLSESDTLTLCWGLEGEKRQKTVITQSLAHTLTSPH